MFELVLLGFLSAAMLVMGFTIALLRRVVPTNEVHIVQSAKQTKSYGKDTGNGNTYYQWPQWLPVLGISTIKLPTSNFTLRLNDYEAYDKGRLPFVVDVAAFFRIANSNVAAQRIVNSNELTVQLTQIVQGAVRSILASNNIEEIMQGRSTFGEQFTKEVEEQLSQWGVESVKNMELMDLRDANGSQVIHNIMAKKKSHIEMESRTEVAKNKKTAEVAEIQAKREVELQQQEAVQLVGLRKVESQRQVELSNQSAMQSVKEQERLTKEKEMEVLKTQELKKAEILKQVTITKAEQQKAEDILLAEGALEAKKREAEAITLEGNAKANSEKAMQLAPVSAQITLAKEIGSNEPYQKYLITIRQVEANEKIGVEQAKALNSADVKVIANTGSPEHGLKNVMDLFSPQGGTAVGSMLEGFANTEKGQELLTKVVGLTSTDKNK